VLGSTFGERLGSQVLAEAVGFGWSADDEGVGGKRSKFENCFKYLAGTGEARR
jgi:hypothetical protein